MSTAYIQEESLTAIANAIRLKNKSSDTYTPTEMATAIEAIEAEGVAPTGTRTINENGTYDVSTYASATVNVPGIVPTGSISITENDIYDVTNYASAVVNVAGGSATKYGIGIDDLLGEVDSSGLLHSPLGGDVDLVISGFTSMANYVFNYKFAYSNAIKSVVFTDLQEADATSCLERAFSGCIQLQSVSFPKLVSANGQTSFSYCFQGDTELKTASFPLLEEIITSNSFQYAFSGCTQLESVDFSSLRVIGNAEATSINYRQFYDAFQNCNKLTSITFPVLEEIWCNGGSANTGTFSYNSKVTKFYFPKLHTISKTATYNVTTGADNIFYNCTALTELHFGAENQSAIESTTGYSVKWGAPSTCQILFDL